MSKFIIMEVNTGTYDGLYSCQRDAENALIWYTLYYVGSVWNVREVPNFYPLKTGDHVNNPSRQKLLAKKFALRPCLIDRWEAETKGKRFAFKHSKAMRLAYDEMQRIKSMNEKR